MTAICVVTAPPAAGLSDPHVDQIRAQVPEAEAVRRLSPNAVEFAAPARAEISSDKVDINWVAPEGRRKKLLIADMDSTMIPVECIDEVADFAGVRDQVVAITEPAMRGEISFEEALIARVGLLAGLAEDRLAAVWDERISLNPGARVLVRTMSAHGAYAALVSGGFTYFTERVAAAAGFDVHRANLLEIRDGALTGAVGMPILGREAKLEALNEITAAKGITPADALAVGDGANDLAMIGAAGLGVAYHAKPIVAEAAGASIRHGDLTALLYLQGYTDAEFAHDA